MDLGKSGCSGAGEFRVMGKVTTRMVSHLKIGLPEGQSSIHDGNLPYVQDINTGREAWLRLKMVHHLQLNLAPVKFRTTSLT